MDIYNRAMDVRGSEQEHQAAQSLERTKHNYAKSASEHLRGVWSTRSLISCERRLLRTLKGVGQEAARSSCGYEEDGSCGGFGGALQGSLNAELARSCQAVTVLFFSESALHCRHRCAKCWTAAESLDCQTRV